MSRLTGESIDQLKKLAEKHLEATGSNKAERIDPKTCGCLPCVLSRGILELIEDREASRGE